jgi:hypothetical protein
VVESSGGANGKRELCAQVDRRIGGFEAAQPEDESAVLDAEMER